jgi:hypothetical protein
MANEKIIYVKNSNAWVWISIGIAALGIGGYFTYKYLKKQKLKKLAENAVRGANGSFTKEEIDAAYQIDGIKVGDKVKVKSGNTSKVWTIIDKTKPIDNKNLKFVSKEIQVPNTSYTVDSVGVEALSPKGLKAWAYIKDSLEQVFQVYTNTLIKI